MVRSGPFWEYVEEKDGLQCNFCDLKLALGTSISRFKLHLSGVEGRGVKICTGVPDDVKESAFLAIQNANKRPKTMASSSQNELRNTGSTFSTEQANGADIPIPTVDVERMQTEVMSIGHGMETTDFPLLQPSTNLRQTNASASQCLPQQQHVTNPQHGLTYDASYELTPQNESSSCSLRIDDANQYPSLQPILATTTDSSESGTFMHLTHDIDWNILHPERTNEEAPMTNCPMPIHPHLAHQKEIGPQNQFGGSTQATIPPNGDGTILQPERADQQEATHYDEEADQPGVRDVEIDQSEQRTTMMGNASNFPHGERAGITEATRPPNENGSNLPPAGAVGHVDLVSQAPLQNWQQTYAYGSLMNDDLPGNSRDNSRAELAPRAEIVSLKETRGVAFITKKLVGRMFERNKNTVWSLLKKDEVSSIGIYGMGGVGKTALMTHVHKKLLKETSAFGNVSWVTVSHDFSIPKLQNLIAKTIKLDLLHEDGVMERAAKLCEALEKKKSVIILDDLWDNFTREDIGIPDACKLIVTSRSLEICRGVDCQEKMIIEPLSEEEAWTLFEEKLGCHVQLTPEVTAIARFVAKECDGLPLGIITMAASMRGVDDVHEWRNVLTELKESKVGKQDMEFKVFKILKYSYLRLNDRGLQQSFLYSALFPEDFHIDREDLINFMISEGIIERMRSRREEFDKGHAILNKLENVCLLEATRYRFVKMHDLIRDMAIQIMVGSPRAMVEAGAQLTELPHEEKWTPDLVRVSLMDNNIHGILSSRPSCPRLSTLLLQRNLDLKVFEESFFRQFPVLKVLDLSSTAIQNLPSSISDLVDLTALLLKNCKQLRHLPSLAKLRALKMLDVRYTGLEEVPQGMELLSNLRYLNMNNARLKAFPTGILPHLLCLQSLNLFNISIAKVEELAFLKKLEILECRFNNLLDFNTHLKSCEEKQPLIRYNHAIGEQFFGDADDSSKQVVVYDCNISKDLVLPKCIKKFRIWYCHDVRSLCCVSSLKNAPELKCLDVLDCNGMECLLESSCSPNILESIDTLQAVTLRNLRFLIGAGVAPEPLAFSSTFSCLKKFTMFGCPSITKLFPHSLLQNLQNLEEIEIRDCKKMEEIMATGEGDAVQDSNSIINTEVRLPKLKCLILRDLPELKSICSETLTLICGSLQEIRFVDCVKLKKIPLFLPLQSVAKIQAYPRDWWESLEWSQPNAFNILLRFCVFHNRNQRGVPERKKAGKSMESLASANAS